jgi:hypothetical protein
MKAAVGIICIAIILNEQSDGQSSLSVDPQLASLSFAGASMAVNIPVDEDRATKI